MHGKMGPEIIQSALFVLGSVQIIRYVSGTRGTKNWIDDHDKVRMVRTDVAGNTEEFRIRLGLGRDDILQSRKRIASFFKLHNFTNICRPDYWTLSERITEIISVDGALQVYFSVCFRFLVLAQRRKVEINNRERTNSWMFPFPLLYVVQLENHCYLKNTASY